MSCGRTTKSRTHTATISAPIVRGDYAFGAFDYSDDGRCLVKLAKTGCGVKAKDVVVQSSQRIAEPSLQSESGGRPRQHGSRHGSNQGFPV